ncbi:MAG: NIL domain-containing protein [Anaerolineae bacterium]|nr:NIL domain-containing protein [Anaerolineae bacterium]
MIVEHKVQLSYPQHLLDKPLIYELIRQFDLLVNILEARVSAEAGWLVVGIRGEQERVQQGLAWIAGQGVQVEVLSEHKEEP